MSIKKYLNNLSINHFIFDIKYTKKELDYINNLEITNSNNFDYFGDINNIIFPNIFNNQTLFNNIVLKLIRKISKSYNTNFFWLSIRISLPNTNFNIPRWHIDGTFFNSNRIQSKFITVLKGPGTLFIKKSKNTHEIYNQTILNKYKEIQKDKKYVNEIYKKDIEEKYRKILANKFKNIKYKQLKNDQGLIFLVGKDGLLHSEPKIDESRIFISILPGSQEEIQELKNRWGY